MIKPKKSLENIKSYGVEQYARPWLMKLDANENYLGPSPKVLEKLSNLQVTDICHYPYYGILYEKLSQLNDVEIENIAITNGADESLSAVMNTYLTSSDTVLTVYPSFSMPKIYAAIIGANYKEVLYKNKWSFPQEDFINNIDDSVKILLITTPNNPTGDVVSQEFIEKLLKSYPDKLLVLDETYSTYAERTCASLIKKYDNIAIVRSLSKDYALAGLRIGYVLSAPENINNIKKILNPYTVNNLAVLAATEALSDKNYISFVKKEISKAKDCLTAGLNNFGAVVYESQANFILVDFGVRCNSVYNTLKLSNIVVKKFNDPVLKNHLRITVPSLAGAHKILEILNPKPCIVFDMDGVLVDVSDSYRLAIQKTFEKFCNKSLSATDIQNAKNLGGLNNDWHLTHFLIRRENINVPYETVVEEFQKIYWADGTGAINNEKLLINPQILENLSKNYSIALFTGRPKIEAEFTLKKFNIDKYFSKIITMDDLPENRQKPDTLGLELIQKAFMSKNLIYLGDTVDDMKCAKAYEITGIGVLPPSDKSDGLKDLLYVCGAKYVINNVNELTDILENMNENS